MKFWAAIAAFFTAILSPVALWLKGRSDAKRDAKLEDYEHAEDIRAAADRADKRLRKYDDAGWRD